MPVPVALAGIFVVSMMKFRTELDIMSLGHVTVKRNGCEPEEVVYGFVPFSTISARDIDV
jgi:hypothetical protein